MATPSGTRAAGAQEGPAPSKGFGEVAEKLRRSTVQVRAGRRAQGSGIIVKPEGVIVTNAHVLGPRGAAAGRLEVEFWDGSRSPATLMLRDRTRDLALLQVPRADLAAAPFGDSERLRVGELVIAIGNPMGFIGALTTGIVHAIGRVRGLGPQSWIQADVRLAPGNSGGPLASADGRVIGVNTMVVGSRAGALGLAIPSERVARLLQGHDQPAPLGVSLRAVEVFFGGGRRPGLLITAVAQDSAAEAASLILGDILVGAEGRAIGSVEDLERALTGGGERVVRLQFLRGDRTSLRTAAVKLAPPRARAAAA
ncbi:MAG: S1C family serine protease [Terriglobales bacterium]